MEERSSQVQLMRPIYSKASEVIAWLGRDVNGRGSTLEKLGRLSHVAGSSSSSDQEDRFGTIMFEDANATDEKQPPIKTKGDARIDTVNGDEAADELAAFFTRPFWYRIWIFQEMILGRNLTMMCGEVQVPFTESMGLLEEQSNRISREGVLGVSSNRTRSLRIINWQPLTRIHTFRHAWWRKEIERIEGDIFELPMLLLGTRGMIATDPRDRIYGLLGIAQPSKMVVDYSKPAVEVFIDYASWRVEEVDLEFFTLIVAASDSASSSFPSWVPNWHVRTPYRSILRQTTYAQHHADEPFTHSNYAPRVEGRVLRLKCVILDDISHGCLKHQDLELLSHLLALLCEAVKSFKPASHPCGPSFVQALLLALLGGRDPNRDDGTLLEKGSEAFLRLSSSFFVLIVAAVHGAEYKINPSCTVGDAINRLKTLLGLGSERDRNPSLTMGNFINRLKTLLGLGDETAPGKVLVELFLGEGFPNAGAFLAMTMNLVFDNQNQDYASVYRALEALSFSDVIEPDGIFFTTKGRIGFGLNNAIIGDVVAIVAGCRRPVILRKAGDHFTFVRTCYLAGFMDGEVKYVVEEYGLTEIEVH
jgi:hypothetical protein